MASLARLDKVQDENDTSIEVKENTEFFPLANLNLVTRKIALGDSDTSSDDGREMFSEEWNANNKEDNPEKSGSSDVEQQNDIVSSDGVTTSFIESAPLSTVASFAMPYNEHVDEENEESTKQATPVNKQPMMSIIRWDRGKQMDWLKIMKGGERKVSFVDKADASQDVESKMQRTWKEKVSTDVIRRGSGMMKKAQTFGLKNWMSYTFWTISALLIQFTVGSGKWAFPDGTSESDGLACEEDDQLRNKSTCGLFVTLQEGSRSLTVLSAFIVGGFLLNSVKLWLSRRSSYCALCGATRNLLINLCSIVRNAKERKTLVRWAVLGFELSVLKGRGLIDLTDGENYLQNLRLLRNNEWQVMINGDRHTTVWFWIQEKCRELSIEGSIDAFGFQTICNAVTLSNDKARDLMSCIERDQPPPYVFVCAVLININLCLRAFATGIQWGIWMFESNGAIWGEPKMYVEILILLAYTTIYAMLFDVCTLLYNPYGPRVIDIPHYDIGSGLRHLAKQLQKAKLPNTVYSPFDDPMDSDGEEDDEDNYIDHTSEDYADMQRLDHNIAALSVSRVQRSSLLGFSVAPIRQRRTSMTKKKISWFKK